MDDPGQGLGGAEAARGFRLSGRKEPHCLLDASPRCVRVPGASHSLVSPHSIRCSRCGCHFFKGGEVAGGHAIPFLRRNRSRGWIWACSPLDTLLGGRAAHPQTPAPKTPRLGSGSCVSALGSGAQSPSPWSSEGTAVLYAARPTLRFSSLQGLLGQRPRLR